MSGVADPLPGIDTFHLMFSVSLHVTGGFAFGAMPLARGPRHCGHDSSAESARIGVLSANRHAAIPANMGKQFTSRRSPWLFAAGSVLIWRNSVLIIVARICDYGSGIAKDASSERMVTR
jgi:hypothetical protein